MTGQLIGTGGEGDGLERCACGAIAAGPCARCRKPLCGDCCVITEHGAQPWAICRACARRGGTSLRGAWFGLLVWLGGALLLLVALVALLAWWAQHR
ncbi:MAG TPA: hypothetical protein VG963_16245 [Polyangiaceae bacterium]|nr:hypothetical protein [Polyangiaceae bacterium]